VVTSHSRIVRVRKKLGLTLVSEKLKGERVYRIVSLQPRKGKASRTAA
jgi:hypothetical protein